MKDIFTDLYKKVIGFFQKQEDETEKGRDVACNRLKLVLMQDRTNLTPFLLEKMRGEMIQVLSKYVEMDQEALELSFEQEGEQMALMLSIPVLRAKDEDEIKAVLEAEEAAKETSEKEESTEEESDSEESEESETQEESGEQEAESEEDNDDESEDEPSGETSGESDSETQEAPRKKSKKKK